MLALACVNGIIDFLFSEASGRTLCFLRPTEVQHDASSSAALAVFGEFRETDVQCV